MSVYVYLHGLNGLIHPINRSLIKSMAKPYVKKWLSNQRITDAPPPVYCISFDPHDEITPFLQRKEIISLLARLRFNDWLFVVSHKHISSNKEEAIAILNDLKKSGVKLIVEGLTDPNALR